MVFITSIGSKSLLSTDAHFFNAETVKHYSLWKQGFVENTKWHSSGREHEFSYRRKGDESNTSSIGHGILRKFHSPTIFLKIACDGDLLLPIIVGILNTNTEMCSGVDAYYCLLINH